MNDPERPYNDLPHLPPRIDLESKAVLKKAIAANSSLAKLEGKAQRLPHQGILINSVVLQEARDSSEIENIFTTQDELYQASASGISTASAETKEVMRYREALWKGFTSIRDRPISISTIIDIVSTIKQTQLDVRTSLDTKIVNKSTNEVIYSPPVGEASLRDLLTNLTAYIHEEDDVDHLVKLAVIHYQFEAIHPFVDGNGRTGRILNLLYLVHAGLLSIPVLYLSGFIIRNKSDYYRLIRGVTESQDWEAWLIFMLTAIDETALHTIKLIDSIVLLMNECADHVQAKAPKIYSKDLIEIIFREPYCKIAWLVEGNIAKRQTASTYLNTLAELGVLEAKKIGREKYFINTKLIEVLA
ncbi:MAG: Fic family protein [Congregibacter sp.]